MPKPDLRLRRMHVHIDLFAVALKKQQSERETGAWHQIVIRGGDGVQHQTVANQAPVNEDKDRIAIVLLNLRTAHEAANQKLARLLPWVGQLQGGAAFAQIDEVFEQLTAENLKHALPQSLNRRGVEQIRAAVPQFERFAGMRQTVMRHQRGNMRQFRLFRSEKFLSGRHIKEEVAYRNGSPAAPRNFITGEDLAARNLHTCSRLFIRRARFEQQPGNGRNRRQRLSPKSQRGDCQKIFDVMELARGMTLKRKQRIVAKHTAAVIRNADQSAAAVFNFDMDARRAGVQRIFQQFFHDGSRAFDNFAGGDLICDVVREYANSAHVLLYAGGTCSR